MSTKKKRVASYKDKRRMEELLMQNSIPLADGKERAWIEGWSWQRVADEVGEGINATHVRRLAREFDIKMVPPPPPPDLSQRVSILEQKVEALLEYAAALDKHLSYPNVEFRNASDTGDDAGGVGGSVRGGEMPVSPARTLQQAAGEGVVRAEEGRGDGCTDCSGGEPVDAGGRS